jgi:hypothetical protein
VPLTAEIQVESADRRGAVRRTLRLRINSQLSRDAVEAVIRNLSEYGLLLETGAHLTLGERLHVELPEVGMRPAIVMWNHGRLYGCEFKVRLPKKVVSATLLRAPSEGSVGGQIDVARPVSPSESGDMKEAEVDNGTLLVLIISLAVLLLVALLFLSALLPSPAR